MKKILYFTAILAIAASCQKDEVTTKLEGNLQEVTFTTATPAFTMNPETKTHLGTLKDGVVSIEWDADDAIAMGYSNNVYTLDNTVESGATATFKGQLDVTGMTKHYSNGYEMAVYPSEAVHAAAAAGNYANIVFHNSGNAGKATLRSGAIFPTEQVLTPNGFDKKANVSAAIFDINNPEEGLYFYNLCSLLGVKLQGTAKIKAIEFHSLTSGKTRPLTGVVGVQNNAASKKGSEAVFDLFSCANHSTQPHVRLAAENEEGIDISEGVEFYACVLPNGDKNHHVSLLGGLSVGVNSGNTIIVKIYDVNGQCIEKTVAVKSSVYAGQIHALGNWTNVNTDKFPTPVE